MKKRKTQLIWMLLFVATGIVVFSGYKLWETDQVYAQGNQQYEELSQQIRKPALKEDIPTTGPKPPQIEIPAMNIDFETLTAVNEDAVAWLYAPGTVMDYPVMKADDYDWYLRHLPDGTVNANGTLFLDYNNPSDFSGKLNIIYGHNMKSGSMFGSLVKYKEQAYFEEHPYLYLYTAGQGNYRIDLQYGCVIGAGQWRDQAFMYEENIASLLSYAAHNTTFKSNVDFTENNRIIVLSTCSYEFNDARYVVIGTLQPEYTDEH